MYDQGYSYAEIARVLLLDDETIRRHVQDYFREEKLKPENGGSNEALNEQQSAELEQHLCSKTYRHIKDICAYVKQRYDISYSISGMRNWLRRRHFRYKKPTPVPRNVDKAAQAAFISDYKVLVQQSADKKEPIYFVDSVHPEHQTRLAYGWIKQGERKHIAMTARQYRLNIMGGICLTNHHIVSAQTDKVNEDSIQSFLFKLRKRHPGRYKVHIIWDNAGYHRSKLVQELAEELGIVLHYLPAYSPNLNPIERLWKIMHEQVTYNRYYESFADFTDAIKHFFRHIGKKKSLLRARINDNFQLLDEPNFAS